MIDLVLEKRILSRIDTLTDENDYIDFIDKNKGSYLKYIPNKHRTFQVCKTALGYSGHGIVHVPFEKFNQEECKELCILAIQNGSISMLEKIPVSLHTDKDIHHAIFQKYSKTRFELKHIPFDMRTRELCEASIDGAVENGRIISISRNILDIPDEFQTQNLWFRAIKQDPILIGKLNALHPEWMNQAICETATLLDGRIVYFIPKEFQNETVCKNSKGNFGF